MFLKSCEIQCFSLQFQDISQYMLLILVADSINTFGNQYLVIEGYRLHQFACLLFAA